MYVFVDVDLTLIDKDDEPRPHLLDFFKELKRLKCDVVVWSAGMMHAGGKITYADAKIQMASNRLGVDLKPYVKHFLSKGMKLLVPTPAFYIDDEEDLCQAKQREGNGVFKITKYESSVMPRDTQLLKAANAVKQFVEKQRKIAK